MNSTHHTRVSGARHRRLVPVLGLLLLLGGPSITTALSQDVDPDRPVIEIAICLDVSGTMQKPLASAQIHLWGIATDLGQMEPTPRLRVALLSYGNSRAADSGFVRIESPLSEDLDAVSDSLFRLQTGGSEEYVERVISVALGDLEWSEADDAVRMIFVLGDEEADQDTTIDYEDVAAEAEHLGVTIHPIFVGKPRGKQYETWRALGATTGTQVTTLARSGQTEGPSTPYDTQLASLGTQLNATYVPYGEDAVAAAENQAAQDKNVESLGVAVAAGRAITKAGPMYQGSWDLVEQVEAGTVDIWEVPEDGLPPTLKSMTPAERERYVFDMAERRKALREEIGQLAEQRRTFLDANPTAVKPGSGEDLRNLVRRAVQEQVEAQGGGF